MKLERKENAINHLWKAKLKHTQATTIVLTLALLLLPGLTITNSSTISGEFAIPH